MTAKDQAREVCLAIRRAMLEFGRPATPVEIAASTGLSLAVVNRRLQSNGAGNMPAEIALFAKGETGWGLTERARNENG